MDAAHRVPERGGQDNLEVQAHDRSVVLPGLIPDARILDPASGGEPGLSRAGQPGGCDSHRKLRLNYLVFERAAELRRDGIAARAIVLTQADRNNPKSLNMVSEGIVGVMARVARLQDFEMVPMVEVEPITLNAARQLRDYALQNRIKSVMVVAPAFRSRRSVLIYQSVLAPSGVTLTCVPVFGLTTAKSWSKSWHGIQGVAEQFLKLQVLPLLRAAISIPELINT